MRALIFFIFFTTYIFAMQCTDFAEFKEHNGHYYTITANKMEFLAAKHAAENNNGYLAIPNSQAENDFIMNEFAKKSSVVWIGVHDPDYIGNYCMEGDSCLYDDTRFKTIKNEPLTYRNWATSQPDNLVKLVDTGNIEDIHNNAETIRQDIKVHPLGENWVAMAQNGYWMDEGNHFDEYNNPVKYKAVLEFETKPECVYTNEPDPILNPEQKKCTSKVYGSNMDETHMDGEGQFLNPGSTGYTSNFGDSGVLLEDGVISSQIFDCQRDVHGTYYCPDGLAECSNAWDYDPGYSQPHTGTRYANKIYESATPILTSCCGSGQLVWHSYSAMIGKWEYRHDGWFYRCDGFNGQCTQVVYLGTSSVELGNASDLAYWCFSRGSSGNGVNGHMVAWIKKGATSLSCDLGWTVINGTSVRYCKNISSACGFSCPAGYSSSIVNGVRVCMNSYCPSGYSDNGSNCYQNYTYYTYHCNTNENNFYGNDWEQPNNSGGDCGAPNCNSATPPPNNCKREGFKCMSSPDRPCAWVGNSWKCSPYPCFGESNLESSDTAAGANDKQNQGFGDEGQCDGEIYIFNGRDMRCRSKDSLFGAFGAGCCQKENGSGFLAFFSTCNEQEKMLAKYRKETKDLTIEIGEYCSKKLDLGFTKICIQKKKTYCKFNSKLARIIHQQGRPQIGMGWGSPKSPQCRGFTPEELQKLDFSKMDLSEFVDEVVGNVKSKMLDPDKIQETTEHIGNAIQNKAEEFLQGAQN